MTQHDTAITSILTFPIMTEKKTQTVTLSSEDISTLKDDYLPKFKDLKGRARNAVVEDAMADIVPVGATENERSVYEMVSIVNK